MHAMRFHETSRTRGADGQRNAPGADESMYRTSVGEMETL